MPSANQFRENDIAIIGMACIFPKAPDLEIYWRNIINRVDAIVEVPEFRIESVFVDPASHAYDRIPHRKAGCIDPSYATFDPLEFGIQPAAVEDGEPEQLLALKTAAQALKDAGLVKPFTRRTAVIIGKGGHLGVAESRHMGCITGANQVVEIVRELMPHLGEKALAEIKEAFQKQTIIPRPENNIGFVPHLVAGRIANRLDFRGPSYVVDAACASSLIAVHTACRELSNGDCDLAIAGGAHLAIDSTFLAVFAHLEALSKGVIRPLDRRADGMLMGEGVGMVVLKRAADAVRDNHRIYAIIRGSGTSSDGKSSSLMKPSVEGQLECVEKAWRKAGIDPDRIGLIEAHSPGTPAGDEAELTMLNRFFGPPAVSLAGIGSVKSQIGHCMGAAGIAGFIKTALAVYHGVLPPTLHCEEPNELIKKTRFRIINEAEPWDRKSEDRIAGVNAFGFGGINAHVVLQGFDNNRKGGISVAVNTPKSESKDQTSAATLNNIWHEKLLIITADSNEEILKLLSKGSSTPLNKQGKCRLGILNPTPDRIEKAAKIVERGQPWRGRMGIWFSPRGILAEDPKILFMFPGVEAEFQPQVDDIIKLSGLKIPSGLLERASSALDKLDSRDLVMRGVGVVTLGRLLNAALQHIGIYPNAIIGHSIGEWTGMIAAGILAESDVDNLLRTTKPDSLRVPDVVFGVAGCGADRAAEAIADLEEIYISHDNCPHQAILCGKESSLERAFGRLRRKGILCVKLPFQSGFHSPLFKKFLQDIKKTLDTFPLRPPVIPIISASTLRLYPSEEKAMRELFLNHLVEPVRFRPLIEGLYRVGYRAFIQVGVGSLVEFTEDTLGHDKRYVAISANHPKRRGLEQLSHVAIALYVEGYPVNLALLPLEIVTTGDSSSSPGKVRKEMKLTLGYSTRKLPSEIISKYCCRHAAANEPLPSYTAKTQPTGDLILDTFNALTAEVVEAQRTVLSVWEKRTKPSAQHLTAIAQKLPTSAAIEKTAAKPEQKQTDVTATAKPNEITISQLITINDFPELLDHPLFDQPLDWPEIEDRLPVAPATMVIELMKNAARRLFPGKVIVAVEDVQFLKWVAVAPSANLTIKIKKTGALKASVNIEGFAQGNVVFDDRFPAPPHVDKKPFTEETPVPITPEHMYRERLMFHGPAYRGIVSFGTMGKDGIEGVIEALPASGSLLDAAGQLLGIWVVLRSTENHMAFPIYMKKITFFGPDPSPHTGFYCRVCVTKCEPTLARADIFIFHKNGSLWALCEGWTDNRLETNEQIWPVTLKPNANLLASPREGGYLWVRHPLRSYNLIWRMLMIYLPKAEKEKIPPSSFFLARNRLLGSIAVIDAVRDFLWKRGHGPIYPIEIRVNYDDNGRPMVSGPFEYDLRVSFSCREDTAVACVREGVDVGIELERIEERSMGFIDKILSEGEIGILTIDNNMSEPRRDELVTRVWCAKEALNKAKGGKGGEDDLRKLRIEEVSGSGERFKINGEWVETRREEDYIVAITVV